MSEPLQNSFDGIDRNVGLIKQLGIEFDEMSQGRVVAHMPITPDILQPFGFVHGGATIALLETVASLAAEYYADFEVERPFGIDVHVRHWKSGKAGMLRGVAELDHVEGSKQFWHVVALDDDDDVVSDGTIITKVATLTRLAEKEQERAKKKQFKL